MHEVEAYGDVTRVRLWNAPSRAVGMHVSVYLVRGILVDAGFPNASAEVGALLERLKPRALMLTHWHEDHAGNAALAVSRGIPVWLDPATEEMLVKRPGLRAYRLLTWGRPAEWIAPRERFVPELEPVHTPGHSHDHQVLWDASTGTLFGGDLWLGVRAKMMHEREDPYVLVASLQRAAALAPERMFDAHRGLVKDPVKALDAKRAFWEEMLGAIETRLRAGDSVRSILRTVMGGEELTGYASLGEYSRRSVVLAVAKRVL
ncbi:MAG: beta-lactamase domain protein [Gemmatimonadetes bacterium]|nr:beta-lactamase domain protein [Gemmatimonadota bacterium]